VPTTSHVPGASSQARRPGPVALNPKYPVVEVIRPEPGRRVPPDVLPRSLRTAPATTASAQLRRATEMGAVAAAAIVERHRSVRMSGLSASESGFAHSPGATSRRRPHRPPDESPNPYGNIATTSTPSRDDQHDTAQYPTDLISHTSHSVDTTSSNLVPRCNFSAELGKPTAPQSRPRHGPSEAGTVTASPMLGRPDGHKRAGRQVTNDNAGCQPPTCSTSTATCRLPHGPPAVRDERQPVCHPDGPPPARRRRPRDRARRPPRTRPARP